MLTLSSFSYHPRFQSLSSVPGFLSDVFETSGACRIVLRSRPRHLLLGRDERDAFLRPTLRIMYLWHCHSVSVYITSDTSLASPHLAVVTVHIESRKYHCLCMQHFSFRPCPCNPSYASVSDSARFDDVRYSCLQRARYETGAKRRSKVYSAG